MRWVSAISERESLVEALDGASAELHAGMCGDGLDLVFVFASQHHLFDFGRVLERVRENFGNTRVVGCSAASVVGSRLELEDRPGVSLMGANLPGVEMAVAAISREELPELDGSPRPWRDLVGVDPELEPDFIVLTDPFSIDTQRLLDGLDYAYPKAKIVGGLASGAHGPGATALFLDSQIEPTGALVLALWGNIRVDALVAQGCRPVGEPARVTACDGHLLAGLDEKPPTQFLENLFESLDDADQQLAKDALQLGLVVDEMREEIGHGDFLVRNILGMHRESGIVAIGADLQPGQTVQFHVRDRDSASVEIRRILDRYASSGLDPEPAGALQFSCLGRGHRLFGSSHHDIGALQEALGPIPVAGLFCNGEIGPVGTSSFVHGYTTSFAIFRPRGE